MFSLLLLDWTQIGLGGIIRYSKREVEAMLEVFSTETLETILDALPVEVSFVDENDTVRYYSKGDKRIFKRTPAVIGKKVQDCHPPKSLHKVEQVISDLKSGKRDVTEFW